MFCHKEEYAQSFTINIGNKLSLCSGYAHSWIGR